MVDCSAPVRLRPRTKGKHCGEKSWKSKNSQRQNMGDNIIGDHSYGGSDNNNSISNNNNGNIDSINAATSNTIDDEFASLFLQELQNTRAESLKNIPASVTETTAVTGRNHSEVDYMNSMELSASQKNLAMKGAASYAMYLPMETTFNSSFLDLNELYSPGTQQVALESLMKGSGIGGAEDGVQDAGLTGDMMDQLRAGKPSFQNPLYNHGYQQIMEPGKQKEMIDNVLDIATEQGDDIKIKNEQYSPVKEPTVGGKEGGKAVSTESSSENQVLQLISNNVLALMEVNTDAQTTSENFPFNTLCKGSIAGRLYINPESFVKLSKLHNIAALMEEANSTQLFCYRRNWISLDFSMNLSFLETVKNERPFKKLSLHLSSSLRKRDNKDSTKVSVITEKEEFMFHKAEVKNTVNIIQASESEVSIEYDDLVKIAQHDGNVHFLWDQIKFKSATANNRHDAANKYYTIVLEVRFHNSLNGGNDTVVLTKRFESHQIIVRGRNPSFYSKKGDILIGKMKKQSSSRACKAEVNHNESTDSAQFTPNLKLATPIENLRTDAVKTVSPADNDYKLPITALGNTVVSAGGGSNKSFSKVKDDNDRHLALKENKGGSSYQYFRVTDNYYLPPVDVGYFPHYVHHSKQVLKSNAVSAGMSHDQEVREQYNYYM